MSHPYGQNIVACVWDFDKTLIPGYMQTPCLITLRLMKNFLGSKQIAPNLFTKGM